MPEPCRIRIAAQADEGALARLDRVTWSPAVSPAPRPEVTRALFADRLRPQDTLVAEDGSGQVVGYLAFGAPTPLVANAHVLEIRGLAVDPAAQRRGVARALLRAAADEATARGARRLTLRVLGPNVAARALYARAGYVEEGVLRGEFHLEGADVDDHLMALSLPVQSSRS